MIVQIDHVALSSMNFEGDIKSINALSYKPQFIETGIKNLKIKRRLMRQFSEDHDLALLTCRGNIGIELINHGHINTENSYISPIFENVPKNLTEGLGRKRINDCTFTEARMKSIDVSIYIKEDTNANGFEFNKLVITVTDVRKAVNFWGCLGFKVIQIKSGFALLEFRSLFSKEVYHIYLREGGNANDPPYLDDKGFNCIALISNSAKNEKNDLESKSIQTTEIGKILLNRKELDIFFAIGSCGELVEIISINKKKIMEE